MKKICGIVNIFSCSSLSLTDFLKKFLFSYEKSIEKSFQRS
ncbi:hypothetical protein [Fusobacterium nucleatum]